MKVGILIRPRRFKVVVAPLAWRECPRHAWTGQRASEVCRRGFRRFRDIGVREKSAVGIVEKLGAHTTHVADPTLLVGQEFWRRHFKNCDKKRLVCYIISEDVRKFLPQLERFAREQACRVDVFLDSLVKPIYFKSPFGGLACASSWCRMVWKRLFSPVRLHMGATPLSERLAKDCIH